MIRLVSLFQQPLFFFSVTTTCKTEDSFLEERDQTFQKLPGGELKQLQSVEPLLPQFPGNLQQYIENHGVKSAVTLSAIKLLCATVEEKYFKDKIKQWIPGYEHSDRPFDLVLVAIVTEEVPNIPHFRDFRLIQRKFGDVSDEAQNLFEKEKDDQCRFTDQEHGDMRRCITENAKTLMKEHSNLLIVRGSKVRPNKERPELCIVLYVHVKGIIPFGEDPFPKTLCGYQIVILEGIFQFSVHPKGFIPSLMMGCFLESSHGMGGSLGGFVKLPDGSVGCLTAGHIFKDHIGQDGFIKDVYQPKRESQQTHFKFGEVINHSFAEQWNNEVSIDATLIKITNERRYPKSGRFPDAESTEAGNLLFSSRLQ